MQTQRDKFAAELARIEQENDAYGLVTEEEDDLVLTLDSVKRRLERLARVQDVREEQEKFQLLSGVLYFKLQSEFIPRLWQSKRQLLELDRALEKTANSKRRLAAAANNAPQYFETHAQKIRWSRQRIAQLLGRLDSTIRQQESQIQQQAMAGLIQRRQQLENYHVRARFGIARLYDTLVLEKDKEGKRAPQ